MVITRKFNHKVQNELTVIMGYIEVARLKIEDGNLVDGYKFLEKAKSTIHVLSHLLNNRIKENFPDELKENKK
jgi:hypothetical protein